MECSCDIDVDIDMDAQVVHLSKTFPKARKHHKCSECYRQIIPGEKYEKVVFVQDGDIYTEKTCTDCLSLREAFFTTYYYEAIWEYFKEYVNDSGAEIPEDCIAKLTPAARAKVCGLIEDYWEDLDEED